MSNEYDTTGWCDKEDHKNCDGILKAATGSHWWCACPCHPKPVVSKWVSPEAADAALYTWSKARADIEARLGR